MQSTATVNPQLTQTALEFAGDQSGFIGQTLFPVFATGVQSAQYYVFDEENIVNMPDNIDRSPGTAYKSITMSLSDDTYLCKDRGVETPIDDTERAKYSSAFDAELAATNRTTATVLYNHELRVKALAETAPTSSPSTKWATATATQIKDDVAVADDAVRLGCGMSPNVLTMTKVVMRAITRNASVITQIKYTASMGLVESLQRLADFLEVERIVMAEGVHNTANAGQTVSVGDIWGDDVYLAKVATTPDLAAPSFGRTFSWTETTGGQELQIDTYRDEQKLSDMVRCRQFAGEKIVGSKAGYRLNNVLA